MSFPYKKLGLGGGGMKGYLTLLALKRLSEYQELDFPNGVYGTSIGSVIAAIISFGLFDPTTIMQHAGIMSMKSILGTPSIYEVSTSLYDKGLYSMDPFKLKLIQLFKDLGLDITKTLISDAKTPLFIVAANLTKECTTIFSGDVNLLDAMCASCCLPFIFKPYEIYGQIYVDGGLLCPEISKVCPDGLCITLPFEKMPYKIDPTNIKTLNSVVYFRMIYIMIYKVICRSQRSKNALCLNYPGFHPDSELSDFDLPKVEKYINGLFDRFLFSECGNQERPKRPC